jgi:hypothetical protein
MHTTNPTAVTAARIESALDLISEVMLLHERPQFAPYLDRLEHELSTLQSKNDALARARRRLDRPRANDNAQREAA